MTPDQIEEARKRAVVGQITKEEMKEIIAHLRAGRVSASYASKKAKTAKKAERVADLKDMGEDVFAGLRDGDEQPSEDENPFAGL